MGNDKRLIIEQIFDEDEYQKELKPNTDEFEQLKTLLALVIVPTYDLYLCLIFCRVACLDIDF